MPGRTFSREFKCDLVRQIEAGDLGPAQASREHKLARSLLDRWRKQYRQQGEFAFSPAPASEQKAFERRVAELEHFCGQLALENIVLNEPCRLRGRGATRDDCCRARRSPGTVNPALVRVAWRQPLVVLRSGSAAAGTSTGAGTARGHRSHHAGLSQLRLPARH